MTEHPNEVREYDAAVDAAWQKYDAAVAAAWQKYDAGKDM